jgi:hypothetical protein
MIRVGRFSTVPEVLYHRIVYPNGISYEPRTFVQQAAFYALGRMIARDPDFERIALSQLRSGMHVNDVLPPDDRHVQALILRKTLRHLVFADAESAEATLSAYRRWRPLKALALAACRLSARGHRADRLRLVQAALRIRMGLPCTPPCSLPD